MKKNFIAKFIYLLGNEKQKIFLLAPLYVFIALVDLISILLIALLVSSINDPTETMKVIDDYVSFFININSFLSASNTTFYISFLTIIFLILRTVSFVYINYISLKIIYLYGVKFRAYLLNLYQNLPYDTFVNLSNSEIINKVQNMSAGLINNCIQPSIKIISDVIFILFVVIFLLIKYPSIFITISIITFIVVYFYDYLFKKKIKNYGKNINLYTKDMIRNITDSIDGHKESVLYNLNYFFNYRLYNASLNLANNRISSQLITSSWRYILEFFTIFIVCIVILIYSFLYENDQNIIPILALFVIITLRVLPSVNQLMQSRNRIILGINNVNELYNDVIKYSKDQIISFSEHQEKIIRYNNSNHKRSFFNFNKLELINIRFSYNNKKNILNNINFTINKNDFIGIYGNSGSGKTTLINIILGIIEPSDGQININSLPKSKINRIKYSSLFSYIPQDIFLIDGTYAENIAIGINAKYLDYDLLNDAIKKSMLYEFISNLPYGYNTNIGNNGKKLSGGQRQRIALARAFYFKSNILIMDEPTSALDRENISKISNELRLLKGKITIVLISHDKKLLNVCDQIYKLKNCNLIQER